MMFPESGQVMIRVPDSTIVVPVYEEDDEMVSVPAPSFVNPPPPVIGNPSVPEP